MYPKSLKPAFSLTTVLMVLVICMALTAASLQQMAYARKNQVKRMAALKATWSAESGMAYAMDYLAKIKQWGELGGLNGKKLTWPSQQTAQIKIRETMGYALVAVVGHSGDQQHRLQALIGQKPYATSQYRLVIGDGPQPFLTSGATSINGDLVIPGGQLQPKSLHGVAASSPPFVLGKTHTFQPSFEPTIRPFSAQAYARDIAAARMLLYGSKQIPVGPEWALKGQTIRLLNDFQMPAHIKTIRGPGKILVQGSLEMVHPLKFVASPVLVCGADLRAKAQLELACTLVAGGKLQLEGSVSGFAALISAESIFLGKGVNLTPPSWCWLTAFADLEPKGRPTLLIDGHFHGLVTSWSTSKVQPLIRISRQAKVEGLVYSRGRLILEAPFKGHIWTDRFETLQGARAFQNWLRATQIEPTDTPLPAVPFGFGKGSQVLGWVKR